MKEKRKKKDWKKIDDYSSVIDATSRKPMEAKNDLQWAEGRSK